MPYKSLAQEGYFHTHAKQLAKQGVNIAEWDKSTKGKKLPKHVGLLGGKSAKRGKPRGRG